MQNIFNPRIAPSNRSIAFFFMSAVVISCTWVPAIYPWLEYHVFYAPAWKAALYLNATMISCYVLVHSFTKEQTKKRVIISDNSISLITPSKVVEIPFTEITTLHFRNFFINHSRFCIKSELHTINVRFSLFDVIELFSCLENRLKEHGRLDIINTTSFNRAHRWAYFSQLSSIRVKQIASPLLRLSLCAAAFSGFIATEFWNMDSIAAMLWILISLLFPPAGYLLGEVWSFSSSSYHDTRAIPVRNIRDYAIPGFLTLITYLITGLIYKNVVSWLF